MLMSVYFWMLFSRAQREQQMNLRSLYFKHIDFGEEKEQQQCLSRNILYGFHLQIKILHILMTKMSC